MRNRNVKLTIPKTSDIIDMQNLFISCIVHILAYLPIVWQYRVCQSIDDFQNRAIRFYLLGIHCLLHVYTEILV